MRKTEKDNGSSGGFVETYLINCPQRRVIAAVVTFCNCDDVVDSGTSRETLESGRRASSLTHFLKRMSFEMRRG